MKYLALSLCLTASVAFAAIDDEPPIRAGAMIEVEAWNAKSQTYDIVMTKYSAQGPNYAKVASLLKAVTSLNASRVRAKPESIVGLSFKLDADLALESVAKTEAQRASK